MSPTAPSPRPGERWECRCQQPPVVLAVVEESGSLNLKIRDRYYHIEGSGRVRAVCPRCGRQHSLDLKAFAS